MSESGLVRDFYSIEKKRGFAVDIIFIDILVYYKYF